MTKQMSFSKLEKEFRHVLREKINHAESTEDVKKFFAQTAGDLLEEILGDSVDIAYEAIQFDPLKKDGYVVSKGLRQSAGFAAAWKDSDLPHIVKRMAEVAMKRHKHLERHLDKTEAKMYPTPGREKGEATESIGSRRSRRVRQPNRA
jgi:hypothetical protein